MRRSSSSLGEDGDDDDHGPKWQKRGSLASMASSMSLKSASTLASAGRKAATQVSNQLRDRFSKMLGPKSGQATDSDRCQWVNSGHADVLFGTVICINAITIGIEASIDTDGFEMLLVEVAFVVIFLIEFTLRIVADGMPYLKTTWGIFDASLIALGVIDLLSSFIGTLAGFKRFFVLRVLRLLRIVRVVRLLRMVEGLRVMVQTLGNSLLSVGWTMMLTFMIMYIGSIFCTVLLGQGEETDEKMKEHFGTVGKSLFSHFMVISNEGWTDVARTAMHAGNQSRVGGFLWGLYFVCVIGITNFALLNIVVGSITEQIISRAQAQHEQDLFSMKRNPEWLAVIRRVFNEMPSQYSDIHRTRDDLWEMWCDDNCVDQLESIGLPMCMPFEEAAPILMQGKRRLKLKDFEKGCSRFLSTRNSWQLFQLHRAMLGDLERVHRRLRSLVEPPEDDDEEKPLASAESLPSLHEKGSSLPKSQGSKPKKPDTGQIVGEALASQLLDRVASGKWTLQNVLMDLVAAAGTRRGDALAEGLARLRAGLTTPEVLVDEVLVYAVAVTEKKKED